MRPLHALLLLASLAALNAAELVLVTKDTTPAPIIVFKDAPPRTRDAAVTLAHYIEKISGQKPTILEGAPQTLPGGAAGGKGLVSEDGLRFQKRRGDAHRGE